MFLEDELLQIVNDRFNNPDITIKDVEQTYLDVINKCKANIREAVETRQKVVIKAAIDRTIRSYDRFVKSLSESNLKSKKMMAKIFQENSLKDELFSNPEFKKVYDEL